MFTGMGYVLRDLVVAPRSFARPPELDTAEPPELGAPAPALSALLPRPTVVAFLRHVGCPFAEATVRALDEFGTAHPGIDVVAVTHSPQRPSQAWCAAFGGPGSVRLVPDPDREQYAIWGVGLSDREHFAGPRSLAAVRELLAQGIHNRRAHGSRWQRAATFAVDATGVVRWRHLPVHAGDLPPLAEAGAALGD